MKIWLDDIRDAPDGTWTVVRTVVAALLACMDARGECEELSLDHDLGQSNVETFGGPEPTGYTVAVELERWAQLGWWERIPAKISIHSANPVGRKNMQAAIDSIERMRNVGE